MSATSLRPKYCVVCGNQATRECKYCKNLLCNSHSCPSPGCKELSIHVQKEKEREEARQQRKIQAKQQIMQRITSRAAKKQKEYCEICGRENIKVRVCVDCDRAFCELCGCSITEFRDKYVEDDESFRYLENRLEQEWGDKGIEFSDLIFDWEEDGYMEIGVGSYGAIVEIPGPACYFATFELPVCELCQEKHKQEERKPPTRSLLARIFGLK